MRRSTQNCSFIAEQQRRLLTALRALDPIEVARALETFVTPERSARLRALSDEACRARWQSKIGRDDTVLVDRPGRGYGDDYSPWLVDAPVGSLVRVRAKTATEEGILAA